MLLLLLVWLILMIMMMMMMMMMMMIMMRVRPTLWHRWQHVQRRRRRRRAHDVLFPRVAQRRLWTASSHPCRHRLGEQRQPRGCWWRWQKEDRGLVQCWPTPLCRGSVKARRYCSPVLCRASFLWWSPRHQSPVSSTSSCRLPAARLHLCSWLVGGS